jgi:hypothetical protein
MTSMRNAVILILAVSTAVLAYFYYQSRQNVIEIRMPSVKIDQK